MRSFSLLLVTSLTVGCSARADRIGLTPEAADAYVDLAAFIAAKVQGVDLELTPEQHQQAVEALRRNWDDSKPEWKRLVLRSPEIYVLLLQSWRAADAASREQMRTAWAKQLGLQKPAPSNLAPYKSKQPSARDQQVLFEMQKLHFQTMSNVMRSYHEMSMTAIHNINSDSRWHYEYRPKQ